MKYHDASISLLVTPMTLQKIETQTTLQVILTHLWSVVMFEISVTCYEVTQAR